MMEIDLTDEEIFTGKIRNQDQERSGSRKTGSEIIRLRHKGIYKLSNRRENVIAFDLGDGEYLLFGGEHAFSLPPRYKINADGKFINGPEKYLQWTVEDLFDTGETYRN